MPRLIDPGAPPRPIELDAAVDALVALGFDSEDAAGWDAAAPILAALSANRRFLGDIAIDALKRGDGGSGVYGPR